MTATWKDARMGVILALVALLAFVALFSKDKIATVLRSGDTITAEFEVDYKLRPDVSVVKVGYVEVGKVSGVERTDDGTSKVSMKVDRDVLDVLGSSPSATIRATTMLGGSYFVDLQAGGDEGKFTASAIPLERTDVPVELDKVARALQPDAIEGLQRGLALTADTFDADGQEALKRLMSTAPDTLTPAASVLAAAQGQSPDDLTKLVSGLETAGRILTENDRQLDTILTDLQKTTSVLSAHDGDIAASLAQLPSALASARDGLTSLDGTLAVLRDVSDDLRDPVQELDQALTELAPVLSDARPLVTDARTLVVDAAPLVADLVPVAGSADTALRDLAGPVLDNLNGPVIDWLYEPFVGQGEYSLTASDRPLYEETVFALVNANRATTFSDRNGHVISFQPGIGAGTIGGLPISLEQVLKGLASPLYPSSPLETLPPLNGSGGQTLLDGGSDAPDLVNTVESLLGQYLGGAS